jgi:hypothetical protein
MVMAMKPGAARALRLSLSNLKHHATEAAWHLCQALRMVLTAALAAFMLARKRARRWLDRRTLPPKP